MLRLVIVINILVTALSALSTFLQYHYLTLSFPLLTKEITDATNISVFFSVLSLSLPFVISHLVSSHEFHEGSINEALIINKLYKRLIFGAMALITVISAVMAALGHPQFALLFILFSANILLKNLLYSILAFFNGYGNVLAENILKLIAAVVVVLTAIFLSKYYVWLPAVVQLFALSGLVLYSEIKLRSKVPVLNKPAKIASLSAATMRSVRNHVLISIPGYFIFNLNILIAGRSLPAEPLKSLVKHIYLAQGFVTIIASSVRIIARNFNTFYLRKKFGMLQTSVNFYFKVTMVFFPVALITYYLYAPDFLIGFLNLGAHVDPVVTYIFIAFVCIECYQVALTGMSYAAGKTEYHRVTWMSAILSIIFNYFLAPQYGINGSLLSLVVSQQLTCNIFNFLRFKREFDLSLFLTKDGLHGLWGAIPLICLLFLLPTVPFPFYIYTGLALIMLFVITFKNLNSLQKAG